MSKRIRYNAEPQHRLLVGDTEIYGGMEGTVEDTAADELVACDYADVTIVKSNGPSWPDTNAKLDELAAKVGFTWPAPMEGKQRLTLVEKIDALTAAGFNPDGTRNDAAPDPEEKE